MFILKTIPAHKSHKYCLDNVKKDLKSLSKQNIRGVTDCDLIIMKKILVRFIKKVFIFQIFLQVTTSFLLMKSNISFEICAQGIEMPLYKKKCSNAEFNEYASTRV